MARSAHSFLAIAVLLLGAAPRAQSVKVSAPMPLWPLANGKNVYESELAGGRVVYRADQDTRGVFELYTAPLDGSQPAAKLSSPLPPSGDVTAFVVAPNGAHVLFLADAVTDFVFALFRAPSDGSAPAVQLAPSVEGLPAFTPDGTRVLYSPQGTNQLWVVPFAGGNARRIASTNLLDGFAISPDGTRVVLGDRAGSIVRLYSALIDQTSPRIALSPQLHDIPLRISADGSRVVYTGSSTFRNEELYSVPIDGSLAPAILSPPLTGFQSVQEFELAPDGTRVVYVADHERDGVNELYSVPADDSAPPVKLSGSMPDSGDVSGSPPFVITPDGCEVVFRADVRQDGAFRLYRAPLTGGRSTVLLTPLSPATAFVDRFALDPAGAHVVFVAESATAAELFSVPLHRAPPVRSLGGTLRSGKPVRLNAELVTGGSVLGFEITPDGRGVVYHARQDSLQIEVYHASIAGGAPPVKLNASLVADGDVGGNAGPPYRIQADSSRVLYQADQDTDLLVELYGVPLDRGLAPVKLSGSLEVGPPAGDVLEFRFSPDGTRFVYLADGNVDQVFELYGGDVAGWQPIVRLSSAVETVRQWSFTLDGSQLLFAGDVPLSGSFLFSTASDGSTASFELGGGNEAFGYVLDPTGTNVVFTGSQIFVTPLQGGGMPLSLSGSLPFPAGPLVSPDGQRAVFVSRPDPFFGSNRMYVVALDGSEPAFELDSGMPLSGSVGQRVISPRGERVVFVADREVNDRFELYSVPLDGGPEPLKLSGALVAAGDVSRFELSPDGTHAVYQADQEVDQHQELYSVRLDSQQAWQVRRIGGPAPEARRKLNGPLPSGTPGPFGIGVQSFAISPTGAHVAFTLQDGEQHAQLHAVQIERRTEPVLLSPGAFDVQAFAFAPDGTRVVYSAMRVPDGPVELFSVPVDGALAPAALSGPFVPGGSLQIGANTAGFFAISPDARWVVYMADQDADQRVELYARALDGHGRSLRLNGPLVDDGDVQGGLFGAQRAFAISPDSTWVLYSADQDQDEVVELYRSALPSPRRRDGALRPR